MATITVDTFLDGGTARTAGESWACNGGRLTVRTDTRWHLNAPASMTGSLAAVAISATLGGGYTLEGRNVRWLAFAGGSGTVPAIGTTITKGGVSGYFLGVWAAITSAPTAVGAAMPATGFIKFREVTAGPFTAGALTGITATAAGADVVGWIEVVHDQAAAITVPRLGNFTVNGSWFALGTTTGVANQLVQCPTNGSTTAYVPGVWIATTATPLTDEDWEYYPSIYVAGMIAANLGTDARSKFVCMETNGAVRIGHNGTTAIGFIPPAGRQIRIPNVIGRQCTAAARATNVIPSATAATRPSFFTTSAGSIDIKCFMADWQLNFAQPYAVKAHSVATFDYFYVSECATALNIYDGGNGTSASIDARTFNITSCFAGGTIDKWKSPRHLSGTTDHAFEVLYSSGQTISRVESGIVTFARSTGYPFQFTQSSGLTVNNCVQYNGPMNFTTCFDCVVNNLNHVDRYVGATDATTGVYAVVATASCDNITVDGVKFGLNGAIANCHPYLGIFNASLSKNIKFRNAGTRAAILNGGSANQPAYIYVSGGNNQNVKVQRCYMQPTRTGAVSTLNSDKGVTYEHVYGDFADAMTIADLNTSVKNCGGTNSVTGQSSVYGTHFMDMFVSDTAGRVLLAMNEPTAETAGGVTQIGTPAFTSAGGLVLNNVADEVQWEMHYRALGVSAMANALPVVTGTNVTYSTAARWGNHDLYYQIDKGAGYGGTWLDLKQSALAAETGIDPAIGFKLKIRAVCAIAATTNLLSFIRMDTVSTLAAQSANLYPLDTASVSVNGLVDGSRVKATRVDNGALIFNGLASAGQVLFLTDYIGAVNIEARKASAAPFYQPWVTQVTTVADATTQATALQVLDE